MRQTRAYGFAGLALLLFFSLTAEAQEKAKKSASKPADKQVTVTLVRWPYT